MSAKCKASTPRYNSPIDVLLSFSVRTVMSGSGYGITAGGREAGPVGHKSVIMYG